jgi:hypothetical protein
MKYTGIVIRTFILPSLFLILVSGCKKQENKEFTDSPIIESYLQAGSFLNVKISRQIPFSSDVTYSSDDINNLTLKVDYNNATHVLESLGDGRYIDSSIIVTDGATYNLSFEFNSKDVQAYTHIPGKPLNVTQSTTALTIAQVTVGSGPPTGGFSMPDPVKISWTNPDASYYLVTVENIENTLTPVRDFGSNTPPASIFKKSPTNSNSEEIRSLEFQYYGKHRIIIYHVLSDYATLYDQNSTSSQNLTNPSTSILNGYGIFTGLNSDTVYVDINK